MSRHRLAVFLLLLGLAVPAWAAPLFPDVPEGHWGRDAVGRLAAAGLLEGYPDGTFRGDRPASRWEVALLVARLLSRLEVEHQAFASRASLEELHRLAGELRPELDALGVRTTALEGRVGQLEARVQELDRLTFYGSFEARTTFQTFRNTGAPDNNNGKGNVGLPGGVPYVNYNSVVGTGPAGLYRPQVQGVLPVVDFVSGRALTNGTGLNSRLDLGVRARLSDDLRAGVEVAAYTSQGDVNVDAYWGVTAPFLSNPLTAEPFNPALAGLQPLNNQPYTRATLTRAWVEHGPSKTRALFGEFDSLRMDPFVYAGQPNLFAYGPRRFPGFGVHARGDSPLDEGLTLQWEAFLGRTGDANSYLGSNYQHLVHGADLALQFGTSTTLRFDYAHFQDEAPPGSPLVVGLVTGINVPYGASTGWNTLQWVNPPGHFAAQRPADEQARTGFVGGSLVANTADTRPIPGWNAMADNAVGAVTGGGDFGPQGQGTLGFSARSEWKLEDGTRLRALAEVGHSEYRSNRNSPWTAPGTALRAEFSGVLLEETLDVAASWLRVDPTYNPALFSGALLGLRNIRSFSFPGRFHLFDNGTYAHNREGFRTRGRWLFDEKRGDVHWSGAWLQQTRTSLYDVRAVPGSAGGGAPNFPVLGFSPGFIDHQFFGYAWPGQYGANSSSSFNDQLQPLEDHRGRETFLGLGARYFWPDPGVTVGIDFEQQHLFRPTSLDPAFGGSQNRVDVWSDYAHLGVDWIASPTWTLHGGADLVRSRGHFDPAGLYNAYASRSGQVDFQTLDTTQTVPYLGADWQISKTTSADFSFRWFQTRDALADTVAPGRALDTVGATTHPFSWQGLQVATHLKISF